MFSLVLLTHIGRRLGRCAAIASLIMKSWEVVPFRWGKPMVWRLLVYSDSSPLPTHASVHILRTSPANAAALSLVAVATLGSHCHFLIQSSFGSIVSALLLSIVILLVVMMLLNAFSSYSWLLLSFLSRHILHRHNCRRQHHPSRHCCH